ncbi:hypothetical protein FRC00_002677, partial [Tulasnella sp. 408]
MKLFTLILFVLAFWPILLDGSVSGRTVPLPTAVYPTKTRPVGSVFYARTAVLQVLPTHLAHHNNGAQSGGWTDSTVLIWTASHVNPVRVVVGTEHASLNFAHRNSHAAWNRARHWWRVGSVWLVDAVVTFAVHLLFSITVRVARISKATVERRANVARTQRKRKFVCSTTSVERSLDRDIHEMVTHKQLSINTLTLEGRLVLSSGPSTSDSPVEWTVLFHPRQYYRPTCSVTESSDRNTEPDVAYNYVLNMLFRQVTAYHPWTWYTPGILINVSKEVVKEVHITRKPTSVRSIPWIGGAAKSDDNGPKVQRRMIVVRAVRKPTFASSITRIGGPPKPPVHQHVLPKRPRYPTPWIQKFTLEGRLLMYAGCTPGQPVNWVIQFRPYSGYHLTMHGDNSTTHQREFADGVLFKILIRGGTAYPPSVVYVPDILLDMPGELVNRSNILARPTDAPDLIITVTDTSPSAPCTPDITTIIDSRGPAITAVTAPVELDTSADAESSVPLDLRENRGSAERVYELVPANAKEDNDKSGESFDYTNSHTSDSEEVESFTPIKEAPTSPNPSSLDPAYNDLIREQRAAVFHELR